MPDEITPENIREFVRNVAEVHGEDIHCRQEGEVFSCYAGEKVVAHLNISNQQPAAKRSISTHYYFKDKP